MFDCVQPNRHRFALVRLDAVILVRGIDARWRSHEGHRSILNVRSCRSAVVGIVMMAAKAAIIYLVHRFTGRREAESDSLGFIIM